MVIFITVFERLDQDQEPQASGLSARAVSVL